MLKRIVLDNRFTCFLTFILERKKTNLIRPCYDHHSDRQTEVTFNQNKLTTDFFLPLHTTLLDIFKAKRNSFNQNKQFTNPESLYIDRYT